MAKSTLEAAFERKGFVRRNVEFQVAISRFQNQGGTHSEASAMLDTAFGVERDRPPESGKDPANDVATKPGSADHYTEDNKSRGRLSTLPGHARRGAEAIASVQPAIAKSLFDAITLPDGRRL